MKKMMIIICILFINLQISYSYELTEVDKNIIEKINTKLENKTTIYKNNLSNKLLELIKNWNYSERIKLIINEVVENISQINTDNPNINKNEDEVESTINEENNYIDIVKDNWLNWNNKVRTELGLEKYSTNNILENSALVWSDSAKEKWEISHKRNTWDSFYDYEKITNWLGENSVVCENISWITHTENIRWWGYTCTDWECSDELSIATKRAFDSYMAEKWTDSDAHYRSLVQKYFTQIWLGISIDQTSENYYEYYLTIHYCTELE